jgi:hypothetical protein
MRIDRQTCIYAMSSADRQIRRCLYTLKMTQTDVCLSMLMSHDVLREELTAMVVSVTLHHHRSGAMEANSLSYMSCTW